MEKEKVYFEIKKLAKEYRLKLENKINERINEMKFDDKSHYLIYKILGVSENEGTNIDIYQNKGRFLYKYAGSFLEEATFICFRNKFPKAKKIKIPNNQGSKPKTFEIDCLVENKAHEIKWRDATTDGDHVIKEHTRIKAIKSQGFIPVRVMFYFPNRTQAKKIQETLKTMYKGVGGEYYYSYSAWQYIKNETGVNLLKLLERISNEI